MIRPVFQRHEARRLVKHLAEPLAFRLQPALGENFLCHLNDKGDDAGRVVVFIEHRRIVEVEPDLLRTAKAEQGEFLRPVRERAASQHGLHDVVVEIRDLGPCVTNA